MDIDVTYEIIGKHQEIYKWYYAVDSSNMPIRNMSGISAPLTIDGQPLVRRMDDG
jgi:hypothetical protein